MARCKSIGIVFCQRRLTYLDYVLEQCHSFVDLPMCLIAWHLWCLDALTQKIGPANSSKALPLSLVPSCCGAVSPITRWLNIKRELHSAPSGNSRWHSCFQHCSHNPSILWFRVPVVILHCIGVRYQLCGYCAVANTEQTGLTADASITA